MRVESPQVVPPATQAGTRRRLRCNTRRGHGCQPGQTPRQRDTIARSRLWLGPTAGTAVLCGAAVREVFAVCWWLVSSGWPVGLGRPRGKPSTSLASPPTLTCAVVSPSCRMCMQFVGL